MTDELKPCAYCNGPAVMMPISEIESWPWCKVCDYGLPTAKQWNTRPREVSAEQVADVQRMYAELIEERDELRLKLKTEHKRGEVWKILAERARSEVFRWHDPWSVHRTTEARKLCPTCRFYDHMSRALGVEAPWLLASQSALPALEHMPHALAAVQDTTRHGTVVKASRATRLNIEITNSKGQKVKLGEGDELTFVKKPDA